MGIRLEEDVALKLLEADGIVYQKDGRWYPEQEYIDKGYVAPSYPQ